MNKAIIINKVKSLFSGILILFPPLTHKPNTSSSHILSFFAHFFIVLVHHLFYYLFILKSSHRCFPFGSYCSLPRGSLPLNSLDLDTHHCDNNKVFPSSTASLSFQCSWWCHWCVQRAKLVCFFFLFSSFCPPLLTTS